MKYNDQSFYKYHSSLVGVIGIVFVIVYGWWIICNQQDNNNGSGYDRSFLGFGAAAAVLPLYERFVPLPEALDALKSSTNKLVIQETDWYYSFMNNNTNTSNNKSNNIGFIFYMGQFVDERCYAPLVRTITEQGGYTTYLLKLPYDFPLPPTAFTYADRIIRDHNNNSQNNTNHTNDYYWVVGGHSQGGALAAGYTKQIKNKNRIVGLVLLASTPTVLYDLSKRNNNNGKNIFNAVSIWGSTDQVMKRDVWDKSRKLLPYNTRYVEIKGGNHAYMGYYNYTNQERDTVTITRQQQQQIVTSEILQFLQAIDEIN